MQADDIVLMSLYKNNLDALMNICYEYSCNWRFCYNASKSNVIVFNDAKGQFSKSSRQWLLGTNNVSELTSTTHDGFFLDKYYTGRPNIIEVSNKLRSLSFSLLYHNLFGDGIHPLARLKIYKSIVLPSALFDCKLWTSVPAMNGRD